MQSYLIDEAETSSVWLTADHTVARADPLSRLYASGWEELGSRLRDGSITGQLIVHRDDDWAKATLMGFTCTAAQPGDWLICAGGEDLQHDANFQEETVCYWFVARPRRTDKQILDIVCNAWIDPNPFFRDSRNAFFDIVFDGLDFITLIAEHRMIHDQSYEGRFDLRYLDSPKDRSHVVLLHELERTKQIPKKQGIVSYSEWSRSDECVSLRDEEPPAQRQLRSMTGKVAPWLARSTKGSSVCSTQDICANAT